MTHSHDQRDPECLEVFARLSELLDGELPDADCRHIEEHFADCPPCIEFLNSLKRSVAATRDFRAASECAPLSPDAAEKLKAAWQAALARKK